MIELKNEVGRKGERRELEGLGVSSKKKNQKKKKKKPCALVREVLRSLGSKRLCRLVLCGLRFLEL